MKKIMQLILVFSFVILIAACGSTVEPPTEVNCIPGWEEVDGKCVEIEVVDLQCAVGEKIVGEECVEDLDARIRIDGRNLLLNGEPFFIKGINWNPVGIGGRHPNDLDFSGNVDVDAPLMQAAGINVVRTYETITDKDVLDTLYEHGIYVINSVFSYGNSSVQSAQNHVINLKDHPAILMWAIGNEWNYNGLYTGMTQAQSMAKLNLVAEGIKDVDTTIPVTSIYGHLPPTQIIDGMPDVDIWGMNVYSGATFGSIFAIWNNRSDKPMYIAEYGADAWNANTNSLDEDSQAYATRVLTEQIIAQSSDIYPNNVALGGVIFSFNDEWWKDSEGSLDTQDSGGYAPGGGPYPDNTFNEEYWGVVDIYRNPRPAYYELQALYVEETE